MAKRKKETAKSEKVKINILTGKVTKAKNNDSAPETPCSRKVEVKLFRTPLKPRKQKTPPQDLVSATPFLENSMSKCTSTPVNIEPNAKENNLVKKTRSGRSVIQNRKYKDMIAFSPILADIGNVPGSKGNGNVNENKKSLKDIAVNSIASLCPNKSVEVAHEKENSPPIATTCRKSLLPNLIGSQDSDCSKRPVHLTKRRSVGIRRVVTSPDIETVDKSLDFMTSRPRKASELNDKLDDHSLVKRLRADWSSTTIQTPSHFESLKAKSSQRQHVRPTKRRLTTLTEVSLDESSVPNLQPKATSTVARIKPIEEPYSSSAEFETDDEKENNRSKRAPTWKDLPKMIGSVLRTTPKVRVRRSRIHCKVTTPSSTTTGSSTPRSTPSVRVRLSRMKSALIPRGKSNCIPGSNTSISVPINNNDPMQTDGNSKLATSETVGEKGTKAVNTLGNLSGTAKPVSPLHRSQNMLNKSDLIEQILSSSADGDEENITPPTLTDSNCAGNLNSANYTKKFFHSRTDNTLETTQTVKLVKGKRSSGRRKKRDNIYEFLSQSLSDKTDPNADVIQKMIKTGKVTLAKHDKGKGKPKRIRGPKRKKITEAADLFVKPKPVPKQKPLEERVVNTVRFDDESQFDDGGVDVEEFPSRDQRGFSYLARSAMIKQAGKNENTLPQRKMVTDRKKLLEMAQKFVGRSPSASSPSASPNAVRLSPILGNTSPWRVDDDKLPSAFYFNRNSDDLPSFSSDYIPSTPSKNRSKSKSSFSSNDSNMENIAPSSPRATENENHAENGLNTRRALSYRSPLKQINILEVIDLPPLAMDNTAKETNKENARRDKSSSSNTSLFGFEEFIEDDDDNVSNINTDSATISNKQHLKMNLQRLKRLRPEKPVATTSKSTRIKPVFDERPKPRTLQQMLCSTMIESQRQSALANDDSQHNSYFNDGCDVDLSNLFKDPEPETTFDESNPRRTYSRPFRKKRKLRHNFVMFMDSDASDDEEDDKTEKHNKKATKKRKQQDPKEKAKLNKFVDEFNEMCKEVSQYELIVE